MCIREHFIDLVLLVGLRRFPVHARTFHPSTSARWFTKVSCARKEISSIWFHSLVHSQYGRQVSLLERFFSVGEILLCDNDSSHLERSFSTRMIPLNQRETLLYGNDPSHLERSFSKRMIQLNQRETLLTAQQLSPCLETHMPATRHQSEIDSQQTIIEWDQQSMYGERMTSKASRQ